MFSLISHHKKAIIGIVAVVLVFVGYAAIKGGSSTSNSSATLARTSANGTVAGVNDANSPGRLFVTQLLAIQNIHFNTTLFSDPAYQYLQDWSRDLTEQPVGRNNPFAPIGADEGGSTFSEGSSAGFIMTSDDEILKSSQTTTPPAATSSTRRATTTSPAATTTKAR